MELSRIYAVALRRLREWKGWSQTDFGDRVGLTKSTISKPETGKQTLDANTLDRCLEASGVTLSAFHRLCETIEQEGRVLRGEGARVRRTAGGGTPEGAGRDGNRLLILRQEAGEEVELEVYLKLR